MFEKTEQRHRIFNIYEPTKFSLLSKITVKFWDRIIILYKTCMQKKKTHTSLQNQYVIHRSVQNLKDFPNSTRYIDERCSTPKYKPKHDYSLKYYNIIYYFTYTRI